MDSKIPERFLDCWILSSQSGSASRPFQTVAVVTRPVWARLAARAGIPMANSLKAINDGRCTVQIFDDNFTEDPERQIVFKILSDSMEEKMTIITIEKI